MNKLRRLLIVVVLTAAVSALAAHTVAAQVQPDLRRLGFGGDTLNTAVYLARALGDKGAVDYVTALGDDSFSDTMCQGWAAENIGLGMVQRLPGRLPGLYCIQTDATGERRFLYWRNEAAVRDCFTTPAAAPRKRSAKK